MRRVASRRHRCVMDSTDPPGKTPSWRPYAWALGLLWLLPALAVTIGYLVLPKRNPPGQCEGIGFGCTLTPADGVVFLGMLAAGPLVAAGLVAVAVIAVVQGRRARRDARSPRGVDAHQG